MVLIVLEAASPVKWQEKVWDEYIVTHSKERDDLIFFVKSEGKEVGLKQLASIILSPY